MSLRKLEGPLIVRVPGPAEDRPVWGRVSAVAALGLLVGVAWPRIAAPHLAPAAAEVASSRPAGGDVVAMVAPTPDPQADAPPASQAPAPPPGTPASPSASGSAEASDASTPSAGPAAPGAGTSPAREESAPRATDPSLSVAHGVVRTCRTTAGSTLRGGDCGALPGLDAIIAPRLRRLTECSAAAGVSGKLHLLVRVDFDRHRWSVDLTRSQAIPAADALLACARDDLAGADSAIASLPHTNPRASVSYVVTFGGSGASSAPASSASPPGEAPAGSERSTTLAPEGVAQIVWDVALIRDAPKSGRVVARLQRGTSLRLGAERGGWFSVQYGDGFAREGWVYRGAVGR